MWTSEVGRIRDFHMSQGAHCKTILDMNIEVLGNRPIFDGKDKLDEYDQRWEANWAKYQKCLDDAEEFHRREAGDLVKGIPILLAADVGTLLLGWLIARVTGWVRRGFALAE
jgi:hypothetical protein